MTDFEYFLSVIEMDSPFSRKLNLHSRRCNLFVRNVKNKSSGQFLVKHNGFKIHFLETIKHVQSPFV